MIVGHVLCRVLLGPVARDVSSMFRHVLASSQSGSSCQSRMKMDLSGSLTSLKVKRTSATPVDCVIVSSNGRFVGVTVQPDVVCTGVLSVSRRATVMSAGVPSSVGWLVSSLVSSW